MTSYLYATVNHLTADLTTEILGYCILTYRPFNKIYWFKKYLIRSFAASLGEMKRDYLMQSDRIQELIQNTVMWFSGWVRF